CSTNASTGSTWWPERLPAATPADQIRAAVLVPVLLAQAPPERYVVFTRRRADLRRHAGEISFPGGRQDPEDATLIDTALREAEEEIGLPRGDVRVLGALPSTSTFATNYLIHPFVGQIAEGGRWRPSPGEVDAVLELPATALREGRTRTRLQRRGFTFETDAYIVGEHVIWGATARIVEHLLERLEALIPPARPAPRRDSPTPSPSRPSS